MRLEPRVARRRLAKATGEGSVSGRLFDPIMNDDNYDGRLTTTSVSGL
jgi:hypothetical protein